MKISIRRNRIEFVNTTTRTKIQEHKKNEVILKKRRGKCRGKYRRHRRTKYRDPRGRSPRDRRSSKDRSCSPSKEATSKNNQEKILHHQKRPLQERVHPSPRPKVVKQLHLQDNGPTIKLYQVEISLMFFSNCRSWKEKYLVVMVKMLNFHNPYRFPSHLKQHVVLKVMVPKVFLLQNQKQIVECVDIGGKIRCN